MVEGYVGRVGAGKTYLAARRAYKDAMRGRPVFSNLSVSWATPFHDWEQLLGLQRGLVLLDEAAVWFSSRSYRDFPAEIGSWFMQSRKRGIDLLYTAQHPLSVDATIRRLTAVLHYCERYWRFIVCRACDPMGDGKPHDRRIVPITQAGMAIYDTWEIVGQADGTGRERGGAAESADVRRAQALAEGCLVREVGEWGQVVWRKPTSQEILQAHGHLYARRAGWVVDYGTRGEYRIPILRRMTRKEVESERSISASGSGGQGKGMGIAGKAQTVSAV